MGKTSKEWTVLTWCFKVQRSRRAEAHLPADVQWSVTRVFTVLVIGRVDGKVNAEWTISHDPRLRTLCVERQNTNKPLSSRKGRATQAREAAWLKLAAIVRCRQDLRPKPTPNTSVGHTQPTCRPIKAYTDILKIYISLLSYMTDQRKPAIWHLMHYFENVLRTFVTSDGFWRIEIAITSRYGFHSYKVSVNYTLLDQLFWPCKLVF